ncbi:outer membrane beta-barrel protein [Chitinophaga sp. Ak27]|uniref:outer membrane beta-barrel protein n=1 Tax=Chitinophaga sp. Ak27 TaxID=2726116 RepID=UPI00145ED534|nr:outer membrane beta-barrel protein [Chitinophaga sp. Ak27]NLU95756.1 outer membrane beta-barrel protein [Chitinophaga sp. Ak27]
MRKLVVLALFVFLFIDHAWSQSLKNIKIKGRVYDNELKEWLPSATVTCLRSKDSSKAAICFTDSNGAFVFDSLPAGKFSLLVTFVGYQSSLSSVKEIVGGEVVDVGNIMLTRTGMTLSQIEIVRKKELFRLSKDTLEFNAGSFSTRENASLEDLLKRLPGVQVDENGDIKVNGEVVKAVTVNGKSLFNINGSRVIGKNLQADLVDKIQVIDRDREHLVTDGVLAGGREKVINITIKEKKKKTLNGEFTGGYGTQGRFFIKNNLSRFDSQQQFVLLGNGDNINDGHVGSGGVERRWMSGVNYSNDFRGKIGMNISYLMNSNKNDDRKSSVRKNFVGDSSFFYTEQSRSLNESIDHGISGQLEFRIDSLQKIFFVSQISFSKSHQDIRSDFRSEGSLQRELNSGSLMNLNRRKLFATANMISYSRKFRKERRSLDVSVSYSYGKDSQEPYNVSNSVYQLGNGHISVDSINQTGDYEGVNRQFFFMASYREPIAKNGYFLFTLAEDKTESGSDRMVFDYDFSTRKYDHFNDSMSNSFQSINQHYLGKIGWGVKRNRFDYEVSVATFLFKLDNANNTFGNNILVKKSMLLPEARMGYVFSDKEEIRLYYQKGIQLPGLDQLQPVIDNSSPLYVRRGNVKLQPAEANNLFLNYKVFDPVSMHSLSVSFTGVITKNQFVNNVLTDSSGRQIIQPENVDKAYSFSISIDKGILVNNKKNMLNFGLVSRLRYTPGYVDGIEQNTRNISFTQTTRYSYTHGRFFDCVASAVLNYDNVKYQRQLGPNNRYFVAGLSFNGELNLPLGITFGSDFNYRFVTGGMMDQNINVFMLNVSLSKFWGLHRQFLLKAEGHDLLRQNTSVSRNTGVNYIEDVRSSILEQFFMLRVSYFLGKR